MSPSGGWRSPMRLSANGLGPAKVFLLNDLNGSRDILRLTYLLAFSTVRSSERALRHVRLIQRVSLQHFFHPTADSNLTGQIAHSSCKDTGTDKNLGPVILYKSAPCQSTSLSRQSADKAGVKISYA
jgi:hypothetical protein